MARGNGYPSLRTRDVTQDERQKGRERQKPIRPAMLNPPSSNASARPTTFGCPGSCILIKNAISCSGFYCARPPAIPPDHASHHPQATFIRCAIDPTREKKRVGLVRVGL